MIECPHCKKSELVGAIYCRECGTQIFPIEIGESSYYQAVKPQDSPGAKTDFTEKSPKQPAKVHNKERHAHEINQAETTARSAHAKPPSKPETPERITLQVMQSGELIPVTDEDEVTLGRAGVGQPIVPDIDLTPYQGLEAGVSRLHASIRIRGDEVYIMDLGSANGTRLNGEKLPPSTPHQVVNEAVITLGKLNLKILIKS